MNNKIQGITKRLRTEPKIDHKKEYILMSAIWYIDEVSKTDDELSNYGFGFTPCYNIHSGIVVTGWRHGNCIKTYAFLTGKRTALEENIQGFVTSLNRFVNRKEAYKIALESGQLWFDENNNVIGHNGFVKRNFLYSEDVWYDMKFDYRKEFEDSKSIKTKDNY